MSMTPEQARAATLAARFEPATSDDFTAHPRIVLPDGNACFFYYDGDGTLRVSVHFDVQRPVCVAMEGAVVFECDDEDPEAAER